MRGTFHWLTVTGICVLQLACATVPDDQRDVPPGQTANQLAIVNTQLGLSYLQNGQLDLAWERLNTALKADPDYATAHNGIALVYDRLNEPVKAEEHFKTAIALNPADSAALTNYGAFLCQHDRVEEGEKYFEKAVVRLHTPELPPSRTLFTRCGTTPQRSTLMQRHQLSNSY